MPPPSPTPRDATGKQPADLSRLRIERGAHDGVRVRGFPWIRVLLLIGVLGVLFLYRDRILGAVTEVTGPSVRTARALRVGPAADAEGRVAANGYVVADRIASLATVLSGRLVALRVQEGDAVAENEVIARIQHDDFEAALEGSRKALLAAKARANGARAARKAAAEDVPRLEKDIATQLEIIAQVRTRKQRLDREVERNRPLREKKLIDEGTWDQIQTEAQVGALALAVAERRLDQRRAALAQWREQLNSLDSQTAVAEADVATQAEAVQLAAIQLDKTKIVAPFAGIVIRKDAEMGEVIAPTGAGNARGSVVTIVDPKSFEIQVELSERRLLKVHEGDRATVVLDADPDTGYGATVRKIWPRAERSKGTIELRVRLDEQPAILRPDMAARVTFAGKAGADEAAAKAYVSIPTRAVRRRGEDAFVFVLRGDTVARVQVTLGAPQGDTTRIEAGLDGGEVLVLDPAPDLQDGARVRVDTGN